MSLIAAPPLAVFFGLRSLMLTLGLVVFLGVGMCFFGLVGGGLNLSSAGSGFLMVAPNWAYDRAAFGGLFRFEVFDADFGFVFGGFFRCGHGFFGLVGGGLKMDGLERNCVGLRGWSACRQRRFFRHRARPSWGRDRQDESTSESPSSWARRSCQILPASFSLVRSRLILYHAPCQVGGTGAARQLGQGRAAILSALSG